MVTSANTLNLICRFVNEAPEPSELKTVPPTLETKKPSTFFDSKPVFEKIKSFSNLFIKNPKEVKPVCNLKNDYSSIFGEVDLKTVSIVAGVSVAMFSVYKLLQKCEQIEKETRIEELKKDVLETALVIAAMVAMIFCFSYFIVFPLMHLKSTDPFHFQDYLLISSVPTGLFLGLLLGGGEFLTNKFEKIQKNQDVFKEAFYPIIFRGNLVKKTQIKKLF